MPWKECSVTDERMQFVARRLAGEAMAELCREFGISRKTGYKIFDRYQECGIQGLTDRSRRPYRYAKQLPFQVENFKVSPSPFRQGPHATPRAGLRIRFTTSVTWPAMAISVCSLACDAASLVMQVGRGFGVRGLIGHCPASVQSCLLRQSDVRVVLNHLQKWAHPDPTAGLSAQLRATPRKWRPQARTHLQIFCSMGILAGSLSRFRKPPNVCAMCRTSQ